MRNLLLAVSAAIDAVGDLAYLLRSKPLGVEEVEQPRTFLALIAYQAQENGIEVAAAAAGNAQGKLKAVTVPTPRTETVALLIGVRTDEKLTLMKHQGVHN
jgi:transcriptional regulator, merR family